MKILFIGTVLSSLKFLGALLEMKADVVGVVTRKSSSYNADFADLAPLCRQHSIPIHYSTNINNNDVLEWVKALRPDIIFCFGSSELIKTEMMHAAPLGVIGFHPAKLPKNRGRHPIIWALALGLKQTGSTFFFMDEGTDSGDILSQEDITVSYEDDAQALYNKIIDTGITQIRTFVPMLENRTFQKIPQDHSQANYWRKRTKPDGRIDFRMSARAIYNLVRALSRPYPGAHIVHNENEVKIWKVAELPDRIQNIEPGKILKFSPEGIDVKCYDGVVRIVEHEFTDIPQPGDYL
jgi:methionyl-tRNA formyltransferase